MNVLQDLILVCVDHRGVLDGAVPGHLPPALLAHHVRLQARRPHHLPRLDRLPLRRHALLPLHAHQLHRQTPQLGAVPG